MINLYKGHSYEIFVVELDNELSAENDDKLRWLLKGAKRIDKKAMEGSFIGPRKEMITPWSTNAVEITQNMGISGIKRMERFVDVEEAKITYDPMLQRKYSIIDQQIFTIDVLPEPVKFVEDITAYNKQEGLALSQPEIDYLEKVSDHIERKLTDSEVFGFSQVNSEHCRHKIFNGQFIIDGISRNDSLFELIKKTTRLNPNLVVSAYKDNVAFIKGPETIQFAPGRQDMPDFFKEKKIKTVLSLKAETHNFPTTVEPFNGASTGSGGEIRDRMAGGKGSIPLAGTAVYMTSYPRINQKRKWENVFKERKWLYHNPEEILIKASNGASDFGNKFGQPLICGSLLTFEHEEDRQKYGYDKVIMLAGGIGYGKESDSMKDKPQKDDKIVVMGGDNYRIGMGGGAVSSVDTGEYESNIELNAVQRANPEMQKRVYNALRAMSENDENHIISLHDHGAGGHLNCLSELVEDSGGKIHVSKLPVGDSTLSAKEIIGNESQERMGLVIHKKNYEELKKIAERERAPIYEVGNITGDGKFQFLQSEKQHHPIDLKLEYLFGKPPKTIIQDETIERKFSDVTYKLSDIYHYLEAVLQLEAVACKDWLTNKVDRSVTGKVAMQQTVGPLQLPLNNVAITALDYIGRKGMATSIGHAPIPGLIDSGKGSLLSVAESLTNLVWAPLTHGLSGVSLSANWMWPSKNPGEDARLYKAVEAVSDFCVKLGINIPTGKDSLSMTQKYPTGEKVTAPGTVIISSVAEVEDLSKAVDPVLKDVMESKVLYIDFSGDEFELGGSSLAQVLNKVGEKAPNVSDPEYFMNSFNAIQALISNQKLLAGHDVSAGGLITTLLEMTFASNQTGMNIDLDGFEELDMIKILFSEKPAVVIQVVNESAVFDKLEKENINYRIIGTLSEKREFIVNFRNEVLDVDIDAYRDIWFKTSYLLDKNQSGEELALERYQHYKVQPLTFSFMAGFTGQVKQYAINFEKRTSSGIKAAIIREKGVNGDREMAYSLHLAGFDVKDVHMTDLVSGRETLQDIHFIVFVGGFSNSDVMGSGKGWAGAFLYNPKAKQALDDFYERQDTLSLGVCNGCQLMTELNLIYPEHNDPVRMAVNDSGKFESKFLNVRIFENHSVMLSSLEGAELGIWVAHGEGKFQLPLEESDYSIPMKYSHHTYPGNPNGSDYDAACIASPDGRHLAMMPHIERSIFPWQWAHYPDENNHNEISPWMEAFVNAREWIKKNS